MNFLSSAADAFTNPDSVWYYVIGVVFLVLIFGALAVYIVVSNKHKKAKENDGDGAAEVSNDEASYKIEEPTDADNAVSETIEEKDGNINTVFDSEDADDAAETDSKEPIGGIAAEEEKKEANTVVETEKNETVGKESETSEVKEDQIKDNESNEKKSETPIEPKKRAPRKSTTTVVKIVEDEKAEKVGSTDNPAKPEKTSKAKTVGAKKTGQKPFIDRLLAAKSAHGVYNEIKNTVLSYPGMKAKLTKEDEQFIYVDKKTAAIELDGNGTVVLYLSLDPTSVPKQFDVEPTGDAALPVKMSVGESAIDSAQRLVVFAMNVSMLTRNDKRRFVDYIQKAQDAKLRAKKK